MTNDIKNLVSSCASCQELLPSQQSSPLTPTQAAFPLEHTSADLFSYAGKNYLVWCDRFSGMVWCERLSSTTTDKVTQVLMRWFLDFGFPKHLRTVKTMGMPRPTCSSLATCALFSPLYASLQTSVTHLLRERKPSRT